MNAALAHAVKEIESSLTLITSLVRERRLTVSQALRMIDDYQAQIEYAQRIEGEATARILDPVLVACERARKDIQGLLS